VYEIISKEYRSSNVTAIELRFNPMKRNKSGVLDLDHIIHAALRGMDRVCLEYGVEAGLIFCLAREFEYRENEILVEKAIRYRERGVIGIDLAGPEKKNIEQQPELLASYGKLFERARKNGLKTTVHTGETSDTSADAVMAVIKHLKPHRIGHGIRAAQKPDALKMLADEGITLELCPTCNLCTHAVKNMDELGEIFEKFDKHGVHYTINTDGPYLLNTNMRKEFRLLVENRLLTQDQVMQCLKWAKESSFIPQLRYNSQRSFSTPVQLEEE
jgi:adenosine deaminase